MPTPLPTRAVWCVQPVLISILPSFPCSNPPPLHRPPYCNSTVPPSSPGPYCRAFDQQQHRCTSRTWLPTPTSVHHPLCPWTWPRCSLLRLAFLVMPRPSELVTRRKIEHALLCAPLPPVLHRAPHIGRPCPARSASCSPCRCCLSTRETPARAPSTQHTRHEYPPQRQRRN